MRAAFCVFNHIRYGGMPANLFRIASAWARRGHGLDLYAQLWEGPIPEGGKLTIIPGRGFSNHRHNMTFYQALAPVLARGGYDAVVGFNKMPGLDVYYAGDACFMARSFEERSAFYRLTPRYRHSVAFERAVFAPTSPTHILVLAEAEQAKYMRYYGTQAERFHLLPPVLNPATNAPDDYEGARRHARTQLGLDDGEKLVLFVGSGFRAKGLDRAIRAMAALPPALRARLLVIGQDTADRYRRLARSLRIEEKIQFAGGRDDVPLHLLAGDVLLHPAYHENTGNVLLEALASGLPVLTTDICGYAVHVERSGGGRVIPSPFNQAALDTALVEMLDATRRQQWSRAAIAYMRSLSFPDRAECAVDIIEQRVRAKRTA